MGLDNGIVLRHKNKINFSEEEKKYIDDFWVNDNKYRNEGYGVDYFSTEFCYWRKCWNIRKLVIDSVEDFHDCSDNMFTGDGCTSLGIKEIENIIEGLENYTKEKWDEEYENRDTIWEWSWVTDEGEEVGMKSVIADQIKSLEFLKRYMVNNPDNVIEVYFYDSY